MPTAILGVEFAVVPAVTPSIDAPVELPDVPGLSAPPPLPDGDVSRCPVTFTRWPTCVDRSAERPSRFHVLALTAIELPELESVAEVVLPLEPVVPAALGALPPDSLVPIRALVRMYPPLGPFSTHPVTVISPRERLDDDVRLRIADGGTAGAAALSRTSGPLLVLPAPLCAPTLTASPKAAAMQTPNTVRFMSLAPPEALLLLRNREPTIGCAHTAPPQSRLTEPAADSSGGTSDGCLGVVLFGVSIGATLSLLAASTGGSADRGVDQPAREDNDRPGCPGSTIGTG